MRHARKKASGFTLLEIIIVVIILAVLVGMAIPRFMDAASKSKAQEAFSMLPNLRAAMDRCYVRYNAYNNANCSNLSLLDTGDPNAGGARIFNYTSGTTTTTFNITAALRNGNPADTITINETGNIIKGGMFSGM